MDVEPNVIKKELMILLKTAEQANDVKDVAVKLNDIGSDHIPTTQYRSGVQIKTDLLTRASALIAAAKQGENADNYIKEAQDILTVTLHVEGNQIYSTNLLNGNYHIPPYSLKQLIQSIKQDLNKFN